MNAAPLAAPDPNATAVVQSIFLVLLVDAVFAVVYWQIDF